MTAKQLHQQGMILREQGNHLEAVAKLSQAILVAISENDFKTLVGALGDRALVWKHLFLFSNHTEYIDLGGDDAQQMVAQAESHGIVELLPKAYLLMGEVEIQKGHFDVAVGWCKGAVNLMKNGAEKGTFEYHLGEALYRSGKKDEGKTKWIEGINMLKKYESETDSFLYHVWLSGGYMRGAELWWRDNPEEAKKYLEMAGEIIEADERLVVRKKQWEVLETKLDS